MAKDPLREATSTKPCVLMVEPDILVRQPIAEYLRDCGYKVVEAANADEALLVLGKEEIAVDIVLADTAAPGKMNGFGLARWIKKNRPGLKIILAGTVAKAAKEAGDLCEDGPQLAKPYDPQLVVNHIKRLLSTRERD